MSDENTRPYDRLEKQELQEALVSILNDAGYNLIMGELTRTEESLKEEMIGGACTTLNDFAAVRGMILGIRIARNARNKLYAQLEPIGSDKEEEKPVPGVTTRIPPGL